MIQIKQQQGFAKRIPLTGTLHQPKPSFNQIAVPSLGKIDLIDVDQIVYLKSESNYTEIHLVDGSMIMTSTTLKRYEAKLKSPKFMRVHNSYIIQRSHLQSFLPQQNKLILRNTQMIPVSRSKKEGLMKYLKMMMVSIVLLLCAQSAMAQGITSYSQSGSSDYFLTVNWSANTTATCGDCYWGNDEVDFYFEGGIIESLSLPHAASQSGTTTWELGPTRQSVSQAELSIFPGILNFFGDCFPAGDPICAEQNYTSGSPFLFTNLPAAHTMNATTFENDGTIVFNWTPNTDIPLSKYNTYIHKNGNFVGAVSSLVTSWSDPFCSQAGDQYSFITVYSGETAGQAYTVIGQAVTETLPSPLAPVLTRSGSIKGKITTISGSNVADVLVTAELQGSISGAPCAPTTYSTMTLENGTYTIPFIYWGESGDMNTFKVTPTFPLHSFDPMDQNILLQIGADDIENVDFVDTTSVDVLGRVIVDGVNDDCGLDEVQINATGPGGSSSFAQTSGDGTFALLLPETGLFNIVFNFQGMPFDTIDVQVDDNLLLPDIMYDIRDTIRGFSGAGCLEDIGEMTIEARTPTGCPIASTMTNPSGYYELVVPTIPMDVQIVGYDPQDSGLEYDDVYPSIDSIYEIDFDSTMTLNIQYRKPISIDIVGMPPPPCPSVAYPVLNQDQQYTITINIWESLNICRADTGSVTITDDISTFGVDDPIVTEVPFADGKLQYTISAGDPALSAPFLKFINITAMVDNEVANLSVPVIVSGTRIRTSTIVSAPSDSIPFMIIRDPPGDKSQAWFSSTNVTTFGQSFSHLVGGGVKIWALAKPSLFGVVWGQIAGSIEVAGTRRTATETAVTLSSFAEIRTKATNAFVGEDGDLILGAAINFRYGLSDDRYFDLNTCSIVVDTSLIFSPESFESDYRHSVGFVKSDIIPKLEFLSQNPDTTEEFRRKFASQLLVWEQILQLNRDQKEEALRRPINIFGFDSGAEQTSTLSGTSSKKTSIEFTTQLDFSIAASAGVKTTNFEGEAGIEVKIRGEWGNSTVTDTTVTTTTGYTFADDDAGDNHFFKYAIDAVYGTPVFELIGGASSCPHEGNTQFIDLVKLTFDEPVMVGGDGEEFLDFDFSIQNLGETNAIREYIFDLVDDNNPGVTVTFNGNPINDPGITYVLNPGQAKTGTVRVTRPAGDQYVFEGIEFEAFPGCFASGNPNPDKTFKSTALISAYFMNDCSNVNMTAPANNWLINNQFPDSIPVTMDQYDLGTATNIKLQYLNQKDGEWLDSNIDIPGGNLLPPPQTYQWDVSDLPDGNFVIRWELECASTTNWSPRKTGKVDRTPPRVFGVEKPTTDLYFPGDEISVQFNEAIDYSLLTNSHIYLKTIPEGICIPVQMQGTINEVILVPMESIDSMYNQTFEAGVFGIVDLFGNAKPDTAKWEFVISEPDTDRDGISDTKDRCPGGDDMKDTDMDGLPDDCDCVPTIPANGRGLTKAAMNFDGVNDYINVPYESAFIPTSTNAMTVETWVFPRETNNGLGIIAESGIWPDRNFIIYMENTSNKLHVSAAGLSDLISVDTLPLNTWSHVAIVFDLNETRIYIDGELNNSRFQTLTDTDFGYDLTIGNQHDGFPGIWSWDGALDEMRIWDHARSQSDIQSDLNKELLGSEAGLTAHFPFNEGTPYGENGDLLSSVFDQSPNQFDGIMNGFAKTGNASNWVNSPMYLLGLEYDICTTCTDTLNAAMDFDGNNDFIFVANHSNLIPTTSNAVTLEAWIYPKQNTGVSMITSSGIFPNRNYQVYLSGSSLTITGDGSNNFSSIDTIPFCKWTHIAIVFDAAETKLYINGQLDNAIALNLGDFNLGYPISLGSQANGLPENWNFKGQMDDVRIWNSARTTSEISEHLYTELEGDEVGLSAYYDFNIGMPMADNDAILVVPDVSGNGHVAIPANFYKFGMFSNWVKSPLRFAGDVDDDGRPDVCDSCLPESVLVLENQLLNGTYRALDEIILGGGIGFENFANVILRAPKITVLQSVSKPANVYIQVKNEPCEK